MNITIKQLQIFLAVAENGSVTKAAKEICISQPAASMAIADLEHQLSTPLFDRQGNRLHLNDKGALLFPKAMEAVSRIQEIWDMYAQPNARIVGSLKVGASSTLGNYLIPQLIGGFVETHQGTQISLEVGNTEDIIRDLLNFKIDVGFIEDVSHNEAIDNTVWRQDRLAVFCSPDYPLAKQDRVEPEDLLNERWILREKGSGTRHVFENAAAGIVDNLDVYLELGHSEAIKRAVEAGLGISCLSAVVINKSVLAGELVEIPTPFLDLSRAFYLVVHKNKYRSDLIREFLNFSGDWGSP